MRALALALFAAAAGCADNAVLELMVELPASPGDDPVYVQVQPRRASNNPFTDEWRGDDVEPIALGAEPFVDHISVVSEEAGVDLAVKVRFCASPTCTDLADVDAPERWYLVEHPFYVGERTEADLVVSEVASATCVEGTAGCPTVVDRCAVRGCTGGDPPSTYCRLDGRHLCED